MIQLLEEAKRHYEQLAPHAKDRKTSYLLKQLIDVLEQQWQPIETYDVYKHPENVLLLCTTLDRTNHKTTAPFVIEGWLDRDNEWQCDLTWVLDGLKPTHWQPLPQPLREK